MCESRDTQVKILGTLFKLSSVPWIILEAEVVCKNIAKLWAMITTKWWISIILTEVCPSNYCEHNGDCYLDTDAVVQQQAVVSACK